MKLLQTTQIKADTSCEASAFLVSFVFDNNYNNDKKKSF